MSTLQSQAQQGEPEAIAHLLQSAFPVQPIEIIAQREEAQLNLNLIALEPLGQTSSLRFLEQWFERLGPTDITSVKVLSKCSYGIEGTWQATLVLSESAIAPLTQTPTLIDTPREFVSSDRPSHSPPSAPQPDFGSETADLLSFENPITITLIFPLISIAAIALNHLPLSQFLLRGINIWFHEFGHATIAWLSGRRAIPLPFGWTNYEPNRSLFVYFGILLLLGLLFRAGYREHQRLPMMVAGGTALLQFGFTWLLPEHTFYLLFVFGGIGGEFYLCTLLMIGFFFPLPAYFRWDFYRFPVVFGAAFTFWHNLNFWQRIYQGQASIPWGTLWGGPNHSGGDMNQLLQYGWSEQQIIDTYNFLGHICLLMIIGTYLCFALKLDRYFVSRPR